jgi:two-component system OmpR family response regulator
METKHRILVTDDDANVLSLMERVLSDAGFDVETADSGRAAIKKIEASRPELVTLDLIMPDVDGWGVLAHLRRTHAPPAVLVVTGHPESVGPFSVMASVAAYIVKPFSTVELVTTCRKILTARVPPPPGQENRRDGPRRMFVVQAQVLTPTGERLASGHVVELSPSGIRLDVNLPLSAGQEVEVVFRLPGAKEPIRAKSIVRWQQDPATGLELVGIPPEQEQQLRELVKPLGSTPR